MRTPGPLRLALVLFALFAFTLQSFVTQAHVHGAGWGIAAHKQQPNKAPSGDDQANCPICQVIVHSGYFIAPAVTAWVPQVAAVFVVAVADDIATVAEAVSHDWHSRAPPGV